MIPLPVSQALWWVLGWIRSLVFIQPSSDKVTQDLGTSGRQHPPHAVSPVCVCPHLPGDHLGGDQGLADTSGFHTSTDVDALPDPPVMMITDKIINKTNPNVMQS